MVKLVLSDLDGTIVDANGKCDASVVEAIQAFRQQGVKFAVCSGRPIPSVLPLLADWKLDDCCDYIVGSNGGEVLDVVRNKRVVSYTLEPEVIKEIIDIYEPLGAIPTYYSDDGILYVQEATPQTVIIANRLSMPYKEADIRSMINEPQIKEMFVVEPENMEAIEAYAKEHPDDRYIGFRTSVDLFEVNNRLLSKDVGAQVVGTLLNITADEMMAFGDTSNDIEMLSYVKYGIAMGNGTEDAKKVAYAVTDTVDNNGFAKYITQHVLNQSE